MRKILLALALAAFTGGSCVLAAENSFEPYSEDFESYNTAAIYNSGKLTVSYPGYADAELSLGVIINAAGGLYEGNEVYNANAAENICAYAKTGDSTANAVFGGLGNGWTGRYSHPMTGLASTGGASPELNQYNRRAAVIAAPGGGQALRLNPAKNDYVNITRSMYADDDIAFADNTEWTTDVYIKSISEGGSVQMSLTKGNLDEVSLFEYSTDMKHGRSEMLDFIRFGGDKKIYCLGEEAGEFDTSTWYTVQTVFRISEDTPVYSVKITERDTDTEVCNIDYTEFAFDFKNGVTGLDYTVTSTKTGATESYIDNISLESIEFYASLISTKAVAINGKGNTAIKFNDDYVEQTISAETVKVYLGDELIENVEVSTLSLARVKIALPVLKPSEEYTIVVDGVQGVNGLIAKCRIPFKTVDYVTISSQTLTADGVSYKVKNNSAEPAVIAVVAVPENDNAITAVGVFYKQLSIGAGENVTDTFTGMFEEKPDRVCLYFINGFSAGIQAIAESVELN